MKTSKKILSIVLALVMLTTMVTSAFYASACNSNNHDPYKEAATVLDLIDNKLDAYDVDIDGKLDGLINGALDINGLIGKGNDFLSEENLNSVLTSFLKEKDIVKYLESGKWLVAMGDEALAKLIGEYLTVGKLDSILKPIIADALKSVIEGLPEIEYLDAVLREQYNLPTISELDKMIDDAVNEYLDGEKLIKMLDQLAADAIEGKLVYDENGRKILKAIDGDWAASLDPMIENAIGKYVNEGESLIILGDEKLMELINNFEVMGVPVMQLRYLPVLDALVKELVLADNSDIMNTAANALSGMFPGVEPSYESIISCLIPILSAFNFGNIMANLDNIGGLLSLASPTAFAYLAGINDPLLDSNYLDTINSSLVNNGYTGTPVEPNITLSAAKQAKLMEYVAMEKAGKSLAEIAEAGFDWKDFAGDTSKLEIANAFIKIALGDADKLGEIAAAPGLGAALVNLLCDLVNDLKEAPVSTILKKLSDGQGLSAIANFALGLLNDNDPNFKSYTMYFTDDIVEDGKGNPAFYVKKDGENYVYVGPKNLEQYVPVVSSAISFLNDLYSDINGNGGDLLKTLLVDKLPQLESLIKSLISYTDAEGNEKMGAVAYLLDDYKIYLLAQNASLSDDLLISIAQVAIDEAQAGVEKAQAEIAMWESYLEQAKQAEDAARLAKAKELGVLDESATAYDEAAVDAAIEAKIATLTQEVESLGAVVDADQVAYDAINADLQAAQADYDKVEAQYSFIADDMYDDIAAIFDEQDIGYLDDLRDNYEEDYNEVCGDDDAFNKLAALISAHYEEYDGDTDSFLNEYIYGENGWNLVGKMDDFESEVIQYTGELEDANTALTADKKALDKKETELTDYSTGTVKSQIVAAGDGAKITISDKDLGIEGEFTATDIENAIKNIQNNTIAQYNATIASQEAKIQEYNADKAVQQNAMDEYDMEGLNLEQAALKDLVNALITFLGGDENTKSLYQYFNDGQPIEMLVAPDRVNALKTIVDKLITLFGDKIGSGEDYTTRLWEIEDKLFGSKGILSTLYDDFKADPVMSIASRIKPIAEIVDIVYDMGFLREMIDQYKPLIDAVAGIFGDESEGFIANWKKAYDDGSANHHYVNAILSLLPNIVAIYDQVKDMDAVKELIAPYSDLIDLVLGLLSKDFYDDIINNGIVETILEDENLKTLRDTILKVLDMVDLENKDQIKALVNEVFDKILDGLYQDILVDPVTALSKRISRIADLVKPVTDMFGIDISAYEPLIEDVKAVFDDQFANDWQRSKLTAVVNRVAPIADLLNDALDFVKTLPEETVNGLLDNLPEDIKDMLPDNVVDVVSALLKSLLSGLKEISTDLIKDYEKSPITAVAKRVPTLVDMVNTVIGNEDLVNLAIELLRDRQIMEDGTTVGDLEDLIRRVIANFQDSIGPILKDTINEDTINTYKEDKLAGLLKLAGGALELVKTVASDNELVNDVLDLGIVKAFSFTIADNTIYVEDISDTIKTVAAMLPEILEQIDVQELLEGAVEKPTETIVSLAGVLADALDKILATDDDFINQYTKPLENSIEFVRDILASVSIDGDKIVFDFMDAKKPIETLLSTKNVRAVEAVLYELADFVDGLEMDGSAPYTKIARIVAKALKTLENFGNKLNKQPLLTSVEQLSKFIKDIRPAAEIFFDLGIVDESYAEFLSIVDALTDVLDNIGKDADKSLVGAVLSRLPKIANLINELLENETIASIELGKIKLGDFTLDLTGFKLGDFKDLAELLMQIFDKNFYKDYSADPIQAIFDRVEYIVALYQWVRESGLLDSLNLKLYGYDILELIDIVIPLLDKDLYADVKQSLIKAITSADRIGRVEKVLKDVIRFADIFSYSVNEGLCSLISGLCGVLDGLYDSLALPTSPANGGNQLHQTSRVLVKKLPAIQNLLRSLKPLLGKGKLINLTDIVSDTVKMEKDDILKMIEGVDLVRPYYYGISDVLDVVGENAAKFDWNTFAGIIDALNGVGKELVPALEKALSVSDVEWKDLILPTPEYAPGGSAEAYLVELSGELGEGILTQLVGTLLKAALTIPAIKDMIGDVGPEEVAGLLNDLLEFDFKDNVVEFDAFNTEHLIYTGINLLLPKTAPAPSPATADEVVIIAVAIGTTAAASVGIFLSLKKRREEMEVNA